MAKQDDEKGRGKKRPQDDKKAYIKPTLVTGGSLLSLQGTTFATTPPIG